MTANTNTNANPGNFANRPKDEVRAIASLGGKASGEKNAAPAEPSNPNPGNFANRPQDEVRKVASLGGKAAHPDKYPVNADGKVCEPVEQ
ncbi:unnamed protein product [Parajaminaea phylloscopi]